MSEDFLTTAIQQCVVRNAEGTIRLSSGIESDLFCDVKPLLMDSYFATPVAIDMADRILYYETKQPVRWVGGPGVGGVLLARNLTPFIPDSEMCYLPNKSHGIEKPITPMGFALHQGDSIAIVDDVVTTGTSIYKAVKMARGAGLNVVSVVALVERRDMGYAAYEGLNEYLCGTCSYTPLYVMDGDGVIIRSKWAQ